MSEVSSIEGECQVDCLLELASSEQPKEWEQTVSCYKEPGPNSGISRMQQEEAQACAAMPNLRGVKTRASSEEVGQRFLPLINRLKHQSSKAECFFAIAQEIAPYNVEMAKEALDQFANKVFDFPLVSAYLAISKYQNALDAQSTLNQVKEQLNLDHPTLCLAKYFISVYQEEERRQLPEAAKTRASLIEAMHNWHRQTIQAFEEKTFSYAIILESDLFDLLELEAFFESPLSEQTIELLWENLTNVISELKEQYEEYGWTAERIQKVSKRDQLCFYYKILELEAAHPFLTSALHRDLAGVSLDDYLSSGVIEALVPLHPKLAVELWSAIPLEYRSWDAELAIFKLQASQEGFEVETAFQALANKLKVDNLAPCDGFIKLAEFAAEYVSVDQADILLKVAKDNAFAYGDAVETAVDLTSILEVEVKLNRPQRAQTKEALTKIVQDPSYPIYENEIIALIKAEFSLM